MLSNKQVKEYINKALYEVTRNPNSDKLKEICNIILHDANAKQIIEFVKSVKGINVMPFSIKILEIGDVEQNFEMAYIEGSDSRSHRDLIIKSQDIEYNLLAGKAIKDEYREEYVNKHGDIVVKGSAYQNYKYLRNNKSKALNRQRHFDVIINSGSTHINHICAKDIEDANILAHGKVILDSKEIPTNIAFAKINGADVRAHLDIVLHYGSAYDNFDVLQDFGSRCNTKKHIVKIFSSNNNEVKYECFMWLQKINRLEEFADCKQLHKFIHELHTSKINIHDFANEDDYLY